MVEVGAGRGEAACGQVPARQGVHCTTDNKGVIAGSANFTYAGLTQNLELVLGHYDPGVVGDVATWFGELWDQAEPYDLAALYEARFEPHSPHLIYLRMLWERYGREVTEEAQASARARFG